MLGEGDLDDHQEVRDVAEHQVTQGEATLEVALLQVAVANARDGRLWECADDQEVVANPLLVDEDAQLVETQQEQGLMREVEGLLRKVEALLEEVEALRQQAEVLLQEEVLYQEVEAEQLLLTVEEVGAVQHNLAVGLKVDDHLGDLLGDD